MGRLVLIIMVLFSVTAIYSEANADRTGLQAPSTAQATQQRATGAPSPRP